MTCSDRRLPAARRRLLLQLAAASLLPGARSARAADDPAAAAPLIAAGEQALRDGRPGEAAIRFEQASRLDDGPATAELGMMRAYLQAGDYAHALAWGRLVAGEHPDSAKAARWAAEVEALYRPPLAERAPAPGGPPPLPAPVLELPAALRGARLERVGCGLIQTFPQARLNFMAALGPRADDPPGRFWAIDGTGSVWKLVDGMGRLERVAGAAAEAPAAARVTFSGIARPLPGRTVLALTPGRPVVGELAAWPRLAAGLLTFPRAGDRRLGLTGAAAAVEDGSPVFDACGQWLGWANGGRLETPPAVGDALAPPCPATLGNDVAFAYGRWYAAVAAVWRVA